MYRVTILLGAIMIGGSSAMDVPVTVEEVSRKYVSSAHRSEMQQLVRRFVSAEDRQGVTVIVGRRSERSRSIEAIVKLPEIVDVTRVIERRLVLRHRSWPGGNEDRMGAARKVGKWTVEYDYLPLRVIHADGGVGRICVGDGVSFFDASRTVRALYKDPIYEQDVTQRTVPALSLLDRVTGRSGVIKVVFGAGPSSPKVLGFKCQWKDGELHVLDVATPL